MLKNNPAFKEAFTQGIYRFYIPSQHTEYHTSRYIEANNQLTFASLGLTEETLDAHLDKIIEYCNEPKVFNTVKTDIAAITNALKYRTKNPVDQKASVKMGALLCFMEYEVSEQEGRKKPVVNTITEDPNTTKAFWLHKKMELADKDPELFSFFFEWGASNIPKYRTVLDTLNSEDYFLTRREMLKSLLANSPQLANL